MRKRFRGQGTGRESKDSRPVFALGNVPDPRLQAPGIATLSMSLTFIRSAPW